MGIERTFEIEGITPKELATVFAEYVAQDQANFFAEFAKIASGWPGAGLCQQSYAIAQDLDENGVFAIRTIVGHLDAIRNPKPDATDPDTLKARELRLEQLGPDASDSYRKYLAEGAYDDDDDIKFIVRAIKHGREQEKAA